MALNIRDYTTIKVVQAIFYQGDATYGTSSGV